MATKDNNPGLLSKVAMFVRNPTTDWSDLDRIDASADSAFSKQALKEMIERKRQNDFVRKREFDQLRKLRKRGATDLAAEVGRPSFFNSSMSSTTDDRASTLKKIDEIEAHMSKQWWKGKQQGDPPSAASAIVDDKAAAPPQPSGPESLPDTVPPDTLPPVDHFEPTEVASLEQRSQVNRDRGFTDTVPRALPVLRESVPASPVRTGDTWQPPGSVAHPPTVEQGGRGYATSKLYAGASDDSGTDADLEEASIRFANRDDDGAEAVLLDALRQDSVTRESADLWAGALFDLYRATGQQAKFDGIALEFAERFGRSAPAWFSLPDLVGPEGPRSRPGRLRPASDVFLWKAPAVLSQPVVDKLKLSLLNAPAPWHLDWSLLNSVEPDAVAPLASLFDTWCSQALELRFLGANTLDKALRLLTVSGDRDRDTSGWRLRMDALRLMRRQDEFELVALDYCVTYEVSPPPWQLPGGKYDENNPNNHVLGVEQLHFSDTASSSRSDLDVDSAGAESAQVELIGELLGDPTALLDVLRESAQGSPRLVISCSKLIRVDFSAAGTILNWVAALEGEGCQIQFRDMHRLVASFFNVIGIHEHAGVIRRMT